MIMFSENPKGSNKPRRKRGRPRKHIVPPGEEALYRSLGLFHDVRTDKGRDNVLYRQRAISLLNRFNDPEFKWLFDREALMKGERVSWRTTILTHLGRIEDPDAVYAVAKEICRFKLNTRNAVAVISRFRHGKSLEGDSEQLLQKILTTIRHYRDSYPETTKHQVGDALRRAAEMFRTEY